MRGGARDRRRVGGASTAACAPSSIAARAWNAMSCARSQSGEPLGSAGFGGRRAGIGELHLAVHRLLLGAGEAGARGVAARLVDHAELIPGERVLAVARDRGLQHALGLGEVGLVLGGDQRVAEGAGDQRLVVGQFGRAAQRRQRFARLARFEQDLALELEEIGIVGFGGAAARRSRPAPCRSARPCGTHRRGHSARAAW